MNFKKIVFSAMLFIGILSISFAQSPKPYDILNNFIASGYMGNPNIKIVKNYKDATRTDALCTKITYSSGYPSWGGVYWQYPANNWCTEKGKDLSGFGYSKITFLVRGENGGEEVKFKSGQDCGDSYVSEEITQILTKEWAIITIDLTEANLSNIAGAFCWVVDSKAHSGPVTFYIDDVQYE